MDKRKMKLVLVGIGTAVVIILGYGLIAGGGGKAPSGSGEPAKPRPGVFQPAEPREAYPDFTPAALEKYAPEKPEDRAARTTVLGKPVTVGGLSLTPLRLDLRKVRFTQQAITGQRELETKDKHLVLTYEAQNVAKDEAFYPAVTGVCQDDQNHRMPETLRDVQIEGNGRRELQPGEKLTGQICFARPASDSAKNYTITLLVHTGKQLTDASRVYVVVARDQIGGAE